jgi:UDP-N-acetylglucosamine 3-dehydrogenase
MNVREADEMIAAAQQHKRRLFCSLNQRMYPAHIEAKKIIDEGDLGQPFFGAVVVLGDEFARMDDPKSWKGDPKRAGGGALFDTGHHAVYMMQHFLGNATAVTCSARRLRVTAKGKADDTSVLALEIGAHRGASITVTYAATGTPWSESRVIVGSQGSLHILDPCGDEEVEPLIGYHEKEFVRLRVHNPPNLHGYSIRKTIEHFLDCLLHDKQSEITLAEARAAVATMSAAYESARTGQRVEVR